MDCGRPGEKVRMIQVLVLTARRVLNGAGTTPRSTHRRRRWEPPGRSRSERLTCSKNGRMYIDIRSMCLHSIFIESAAAHRSLQLPFLSPGHLLRL